MNPIILLAELLAHGIDAEIYEGDLYFIGAFEALPDSLQADLQANHRELADFIRTGEEMTQC